MVTIFSLASKYFTNAINRLILTEGIITILLGISTYFFLPDCMFP